ncbi:hypothetical protein BDV59DRAFT_188419 [Aspergillus ambiguus]|uniref:uncharacterized protein n=1 Tax=Aspergillus ambiguus TaxID=176160 RepID=UPI003CCC9D27
MPDTSELWSSLVTAIDPNNTKDMPAVLQSTIDLLETELAKARAALREIQPNAAPIYIPGDDLALGAVAAYRQNLIGRAPDFFYGSRRLSPKEVGLVPIVKEVSVEDDDDEEEETLPQADVVTVIPPKRPSLSDVLSNSLILDHMAPYLSVPSLFALAATSRQLRTMIMHTPYVFRHMDLTQCRGAHLPESHTAAPLDSGGQVWRSERMDESLTEDEFYSGPLRGIFASLQRQSILQDVRTLILDGLSVPADLIADIILTDRFNVNLLSLRECRHLNERKLMQVLQYAVRPTRPEGTPRVKAIYHFTPVARPRAMVRSKYRDWWSSRCAPSTGETPPSPDVVDDNDANNHPWYRQNAWYRPSGKLFPRTIEDGWAQTIQKCEGIIAFDAVLCRGPRHDPTSAAQNQSESGETSLLGPAIATVALGPQGCDGCHTSPEGPAIWGQSPDAQFPLLIPAPFHSSSVTAAKRPALFPDEHPVLIARCADCLTDRWCHRCHKWFCNSCLPRPERVRTNLSPHQTAVRGPRNSPTETERRRLESGVSRDCWECGPACAECQAACQRTCQNCQGDYCVEHNEGCSSTMCDWCNTSARHRMRELY